MTLRRWLLRRKDRPMVRPWALLTPIVVLLIALPMLRPLRHPDPRLVSDAELSILAPIKALVERGRLSVDGAGLVGTSAAVERNGRLYSTQPPTLPVLLSGSYWMMHRLGIRFDNQPDLVAYFLTLLGSTLPVALAAGLVYRMGRLFELRRPWRAGLALASVLATGFISYATVLNPHAPAAALVLSAAACLVHLTITNRRLHSSIWLVLCGFCAALAAAIDPPAAAFLLLLLPVVFAFRWPIRHRLAGAMAYALGAAGPIALHLMLVGATAGNPLEGLGFGIDRVGAAAVQAAPVDVPRFLSWDDPLLLADDAAPTRWAEITASLSRLGIALVGPHGVLSHFPIILLGILGVTMVMHRHWPATTKWLAAATLAGALLIILAYAVGDTDWGEAMFATRFFVVFLPLTLFWAGAWLRRPHRASAWVLVTTMLLFSAAVSILGATGPQPRDGFRARNGAERYTAAGALANYLHPPEPEPPPPVLAGGG